MTRQEFYEKYGEVIVKYSSYYKYSFTYKATLPDGSLLTCEYGGNSDEIYRFDSCADHELTLEKLEPFAGSVYKDKIVVDEFYDY